MQIRRVVLVIIVLALITSPAVSGQDAVRELVAGVPVERDFRVAEVHSYRMSLPPDQFVSIRVRPLVGALAVRGPDGRKVASLDLQEKVSDNGRILLVSDAPGDYWLEVQTTLDPGKPGYEVAVSEARAATAHDRDRFAAQRLLAEARARNGHPTVESSSASKKKLEESLTLWRASSDRKGEEDSLYVLGIVSEYLSDYRKAVDCFRRAAVLMQESGDGLAEAQTNNNIGEMYYQLGDGPQALAYLSRAISFYDGRGAPDSGVLSLHNISVVYRAMGDVQKALDYGNRALSIWAASNPGGLGEVYGLFSVGRSYTLLGDPEKALECHERALLLVGKSGEPVPRAIALNYVGNDSLDLGDLAKALRNYTEALQIVRSVGQRELEISVLTGIGRTYFQMADYRTALDYYSQSIALSRSLQNRKEGETLRFAGDAYLMLGDLPGSLQSYNLALQFQRSAGNPIGEAAALLGIARALRDGGNPGAARIQIEAALDLIESVRAGIARLDIRSSFLASHQDYYDLYIDILMRLNRQDPGAGHDAAGLLASERARARSLLETLIESRADIRQGVAPALLARERALQGQINSRSERLARILAGKPDREQVIATRKEIESLLGEYQEVLAEVRRTSPRYAALTQPQPLGLKEIQSLLDEDTLLLEYSLGRTQSYLWAVTTSTITSYELPPRAEIETKARSVHELFSRGNRREFAGQARLRAAELSRLVLGPAASQLGKKRLAIVADGALQYIPFAALPEPSLTASTGQPLIVAHEIVNLPSASVLAALRREQTGRNPARKAVAIFADPVLRSDDPRVGTASASRVVPGTPRALLSKTAQPQVGARGEDNAAKGSHAKRQLIRSAGESGLGSFDRLIYTRREAEAIASMAKAGGTLEALDFEASKSSATSEQLNEYRVIHFATHGLINSRQPELSGIVLSLVDREGLAQDGFLRLHDVYNMKLNADLVVLSACRTALGKEVRGEGLVGLTRGFMYAGAARVAASLWDVKDEATAELMMRFYEGVMRRGMKPAAAIRAAQVSMLGQPRWQSPYYWAAFTLQGEWR